MSRIILHYLFGVFRRYHKICTSSAIMLTVGLIAFAIDYTSSFTTLFSGSIKWYIKAAPIALAVFLYTISIIILYLKSYPRKNELNFEYTVLNWRVLNTNGDFSSSIIYNIINRSDVPITEIRGERDGFSHQITDFPIEYSLFGESRKSSSIQISLEPKPNSFIRDIKAVGNASSVFSYDWGIKLSPALMPKEKVQIIRKVDTNGTEIDAFSDNATWAGWRIIYPTLYLEFNLIAPARYKIKVLEYHCLDDTGAIDKSEELHMPKPQFNCNDSVLIWRIFFPLRERRYRFKYRLINESE